MLDQHILRYLVLDEIWMRLLPRKVRHQLTEGLEQELVKLPHQIIFELVKTQEFVKRPSIRRLTVVKT